MKKIIIGWIIIAIISFLALMKVASGQDSPCRCNILLSDRLVEAKWDPVLMTEIYQRIKIGTLVNTLKTKPTKKHWFVTTDTTGRGNLYVIRMNIKKDHVKTFELYIREGKRSTSMYYNPKNQTVFTLEFSYKQPYNCSEFIKWKFWDFKEAFPGEAYYSTQNLWFKPKVVWVKIPEIGILSTSIMREIVDISDKY